MERQQVEKQNANNAQPTTNIHETTITTITQVDNEPLGCTAGILGGAGTEGTAGADGVPPLFEGGGGGDDGDDGGGDGDDGGGLGVDPEGGAGLEPEPPDEGGACARHDISMAENSNNQERLKRIV